MALVKTLFGRNIDTGIQCTCICHFTCTFPTTDDDAMCSLRNAILTNAALLLLFVAQHSLMASKCVKDLWNSLSLSAVSRLTYVFTTCCSIQVSMGTGGHMVGTTSVFMIPLSPSLVFPSPSFLPLMPSSLSSPSPLPSPSSPSFPLFPFPPPLPLPSLSLPPPPSSLLSLLSLPPPSSPSHPPSYSLPPSLLSPLLSLYTCSLSITSGVPLPPTRYGTVMAPSSSTH